MTYLITDACIDIMDKSCITSCPVDCIYEGQRKLYIHPDECIDCGACEPMCPVNAIYLDEDVPEEQSGHLDAAVTFFSKVGRPSGASATSRFDWDVLPNTSAAMD
jgi:NAD-dependent dihydropyrimidine dehydrogenase PreA subunit